MDEETRIRTYIYENFLSKGTYGPSRLIEIVARVMGEVGKIRDMSGPDRRDLATRIITRFLDENLIDIPERPKVLIKVGLNAIIDNIYDIHIGGRPGEAIDFLANVGEDVTAIVQTIEASGGIVEPIGLAELVKIIGLAIRIVNKIEGIDGLAKKGTVIAVVLAYISTRTLEDGLVIDPATLSALIDTAVEVSKKKFTIILEQVGRLKKFFKCCG